MWQAKNGKAKQGKASKHLQVLYCFFACLFLCYGMLFRCCLSVRDLGVRCNCSIWNWPVAYQEPSGVDVLSQSMFFQRKTTKEMLCWRNYLEVCWQLGLLDVAISRHGAGGKDIHPMRIELLLADQKKLNWTDSAMKKLRLAKEITFIQGSINS